MPNDRPPTACPLCKATRSSPLFRANNGYAIHRCDECRLVFTSDPDVDPASLYPTFDQSESPALMGARGALSVFLRQRASFVQSVKASGRLLDYGCGNGAFASWMAARGFEVIGLEPFSLGAAVEHGRLKLLRAPWQEVEGQLGRFDVITLWHVLEHLAHPAEQLAELAEHLNPQGAIVLSVPNFQSLQSSLFRGGWFHLDPPRHRIHFEPDTLADCLKRAGLAIVAERRFLPEYGSSGWIQSTLNRLLPHSNFLYEWVKDRGALVGMGSFSRAAHLAASATIGVPIFAASLPLEAAAAQLGRPAALTVATVPLKGSPLGG